YDQRSAQIILGSTTAIGAKKAPINWKNLALVPTAFPEGDRYYMQITWNSQDTGQVNCIAQFLSSELDASRPLNDELKLMRGRSSRLVYSVQKDWVVGASQKVSECGAKPIFVSPRYFEASR